MSKMEVFKDAMTYGVYIMEFKDCYKVGMSSNIETRAKALKGKVLNYTEVGSCAEAYSVEHLIHRRLSEYCVKNEYFNCDYQTVVRAYNNCLAYEVTCIPYNHVMYVDILPKVNIPILDGSFESIIKRGKYLATM